MKSEFNIEANHDARVSLLRSYVNRLVEGEALESVRADFVQNFSRVEASEIAKAEQELIKSGIPISEVQRLCDVHSALFHGATSTEQLEKVEVAVHASVQQTQSADKDFQSIQDIPGHPVNVYRAENDKIMELVRQAQEALVDEADLPGLIASIQKLRAVADHYASKGDLIYPLLNRKYGFTGPASVMWGVDDEIRNELKILAEAGAKISDFRDRFQTVVDRVQEMTFKENNILFPLCLREFSEEDWMRIYYELPAYESLNKDGYPEWPEAEARREDLKTVGGQTAISQTAETKQEMITLGSGHMTPDQILAVLNTIPLELTFVDADNMNCFFNDGDKLFKRPDMAIGRDVFSCHPPQIEPMVRGIIENLRSGEKDSVDIWMEKAGEPVFVRYMAVRDASGKYLGTLETVQRMGFAQEHFQE
ncbi:MAG: DUF438 domain-containing protein [Eubacteriales bacterium]|nr:DUF438 domain-containing protein [Clostridiales bacterium]MDY5836478.1 DUF438 domain-containing protein [Eubacteriales bacterium]